MSPSPNLKTHLDLKEKAHTLNYQPFKNKINNGKGGGGEEDPRLFSEITNSFLLITKMKNNKTKKVKK